MLYCSKRIGNGAPVFAAASTRPTTGTSRVQSKQLKSSHAVLTELIQNTQHNVYESESDDESCVDLGAVGNEKPNMLLGYVCVLCLQLKFKTEALVEWHSQSSLPMITRSIDGKMYVCASCLRGQDVFVQCRQEYDKSLQRCVPNMNRLEERLISLRCPYVWLMQLPKGGEFSVKGSIINVPCNITCYAYWLFSYFPSNVIRGLMVAL